MTLFPSFVVQRTIRFDNAKLEHPHIALPRQLEGAVRKRQAEYAAGRHCAREALRVLAPEHVDTPVGSGPKREPVWPWGIVGSITHSDCVASAAVARDVDARRIGIDVETIVPSARIDELAPAIAVPGELERLRAAWSRGEAFTLVFSAKETTFKCLFPDVGRYFEFGDVEIVDVADGEFTALLRTTLTSTLRAGASFTGRFAREGDSIFTGMVR